MKLIRKISLLLVLALVLNAALCACGGGNSSEQAQEADTSSAGEIVYGGEITVGIAQDLDDSLDPHKMTAAGTREVLFNVFEGLVKPTTDGNLIPAVASDYTISDDASTFTFTLREGVRFHNGDEVTVGDVVYSISRASGLDSGTPLVAGFPEIASIETPDDSTVVITTAQPSLSFLSWLTAAIIPEGYDGQDTAPIGTGPFKFVSRSAQENIIIERFEDYWGEGAYLDRVTYRILENSNALIMALKSGSIDLVAHLTASEVAELGDGFTVVEGTMNLVQALYLNNAVEPFNNADVRRALCYAINRQEIMDMIADGRGTAVGSSIYPAFGKYFLPELCDYYEYDPARARELLAEAGYPNGFSFTITVPSNYTPHVDTAQVLVEQLKAVGVTATIELVEWTSWLTDVYAARDFESTVIGFDASTITAGAMLDRWVSTADNNMINFSDSEYDEVMAQATVCADDEEQTELYKRAETILTEQAANLYIQDLCDLVVMASDLGGYEFYPLYVMDMSLIYHTA